MLCALPQVVFELDANLTSTCPIVLLYSLHRASVSLLPTNASVGSFVFE